MKKVTIIDLAELATRPVQFRSGFVGSGVFMQLNS